MFGAGQEHDSFWQQMDIDGALFPGAEESELVSREPVRSFVGGMRAKRSDQGRCLARPSNTTV